MDNAIEGSKPTRVYTTADGRTVIEQPEGSVVLSSSQILAVIDELHACYDYCAAWKQTHDPSSAEPKQ